MNIKNYIVSTLAAVVGAAALAGCASASRDQAALQARARISRIQAEQAALTQLPGGVIKDGELDDDRGKLIWSFDVATPDSKSLAEVDVDATTGGVICVSTEIPER